MGDENESGNSGGEYQKLPQKPKKGQTVVYSGLGVARENEYQQLPQKPKDKPDVVYSGLGVARENEHQQLQQDSDTQQDSPVNHEQFTTKDNYSVEDIQEILKKEPDRIIRLILEKNNRQQLAQLLKAMRNNGVSKPRINLVRNAMIPGVEFMTSVQAMDRVQKPPNNPVLYSKSDKKGSLSICYKDDRGEFRQHDVMYKPKRGLLRKKEAEYRVTVDGKQYSFASTQELFNSISIITSRGPKMDLSDTTANPQQGIDTASSEPLPSLYTEDLSSGPQVSGSQSGPQAQGPQAYPPNHGQQQVQAPPVHGPQQRRQHAGPLTFSGGASQHQRSATVALSLDDRALVHDNVIPSNAKAHFSEQLVQGAVPKPMISSEGNQLTVTFTPKDMTVDQSPIKIDQQTGKYHVDERSFDSLQEVIQGFERAAPNHTRTAGPQLPSPPKR